MKNISHFFYNELKKNQLLLKQKLTSQNIKISRDISFHSLTHSFPFYFLSICLLHPLSPSFHPHLSILLCHIIISLHSASLFFFYLSPFFKVLTSFSCIACVSMIWLHVMSFFMNWKYSMQYWFFSCMNKMFCFLTSRSIVTGMAT